MTEFRRCDRCKTEIEPIARHYVVTRGDQEVDEPPYHLCPMCAASVFNRPSLAGDFAGEFWRAYRPTEHMERVSKALEAVKRPLSKRGLYEATGAMTDGNRLEKQSRITEAIRMLEIDGHITITPGPRGAALHTLIRPYRVAEETMP